MQGPEDAPAATAGAGGDARSNRHRRIDGASWGDPASVRLAGERVWRAGRNPANEMRGRGGRDTLADTMRLVYHIVLSGFLLVAVGCSSDVHADGWPLGADAGGDARSGADGSDLGETGSVDAGPNAAIAGGCVTYIGGYDRGVIYGDSEDGKRCIALGLMSPVGGGENVEIRVTPELWSVVGASFFPAPCAEVPDSSSAREFVATDGASGSIEFLEGEKFPENRMTIDVTLSHTAEGESRPVTHRLSARNASFGGVRSESCPPWRR